MLNTQPSVCSETGGSCPSPLPVQPLKAQGLQDRRPGWAPERRQRKSARGHAGFAPYLEHPSEVNLTQRSQTEGHLLLSRDIPHCYHEEKEVAGEGQVVKSHPLTQAPRAEAILVLEAGPKGSAFGRRSPSEVLPWAHLCFRTQAGATGGRKSPSSLTITNGSEFQHSRPPHGHCPQRSPPPPRPHL